MLSLIKFGIVTANKACKTVFYNSIEKKENSGIFHKGETATLPGPTKTYFIFPFQAVYGRSMILKVFLLVLFLSPKNNYIL